jgi:hypothetical protein
VVAAAAEDREQPQRQQIVSSYNSSFIALIFYWFTEFV